MMFMPIYENPKDDEHIYSWILNLADLNGISPKECMKYYFPVCRWKRGVNTIENFEGNGFVGSVKYFVFLKKMAPFW